MAKAYVITKLESDGSCNDPDCCGEARYDAVVVKCFDTKEIGRAHV